MTPAERRTARALFFRVMRDAGGRMLPSEAAWFVAGMLGISSVAVLLAVARSEEDR